MARNPPSMDTEKRLLQGGGRVVLAVKKISGSVAGFITAISDEVLFAYIPFLEVLLLYLMQVIGTELMRRMLELLGEPYMVDLIMTLPSSCSIY